MIAQTNKKKLLIYDSDEEDHSNNIHLIQPVINSEIKQKKSKQDYFQINKISKNFLQENYNQQQVQYTPIDIKLVNGRNSNNSTSNDISDKQVIQKPNQKTLQSLAKSQNSQIQIFHKKKVLYYSDQSKQASEEQKKEQSIFKSQRPKQSHLGQSSKCNQQVKKPKLLIQYSSDEYQIIKKENPQIKQKNIQKKNIYSQQTTQLRQIQSQEVINRLDFSHQALKQNEYLKLTIKRDKQGFNSFWPQYDVTFSTDCKYLMSIKKKAITASPYYYISGSNYDFQKGPNYFGKIRSNFSGYAFNVYDNGYNPKNSTCNLRKILATIEFVNSQVEKNGPRCFFVYTLKQQQKYQNLQNYSKEELSLSQLYKIQSNRNKINVFKNRKAIYNQKINGYVMDFGGRISKASVKNFILEDRNGNEVLMFGRIGDNIFTMYISHPLSPAAAIGVVIANFEFKPNSN